MAKTLYQKYVQEISEWDWEGILTEAKDSVEEHYPDENIGAAFLGSVFTLTPSGKYYTPFARNNVSKREAYRDEQWYKALEHVAEYHGMYIDAGENDPCDLYACVLID